MYADGSRTGDVEQRRPSLPALRLGGTMHATPSLALAEIADSTRPLPERAQGMLEQLRRLVPFDGAFLAFADPVGHGYHSLVSLDLDVPTVEFLSGPQV